MRQNDNLRYLGGGVLLDPANFMAQVVRDGSISWTEPKHKHSVTDHYERGLLMRREISDGKQTIEAKRGVPFVTISGDDLYNMSVDAELLKFCMEQPSK